MRDMKPSDYSKLPYTIEAIQDPNGGWFARVAEFPGCMTQAETWNELGIMILDAMEGWITIMLENGYPIPAPKEE